MYKEAKRVDALLRSSIKHAVELGFKIQPGRTFCRDDNRCCAVGSMLVHEKDDAYLSALDHCARMIGVQTHECVSIAQGFDWSTAPGRDHNGWYKLGADIRKDFELGVL